MHTLTGKARIAGDGHLHVDLPVEGLTPGEVDVVVLIHPTNGKKKRDIRELRGLGKEVWRGQDAQEYVDKLRDEWND